MSGASPKTSGSRGLRSDDLVKGRRGVVSKVKQAEAKAVYGGSVLQKWNAAVSQARAALGMTTSVPFGGDTENSKRFHEFVKAIRCVEGW